jgi:hypothetical protein
MTRDDRPPGMSDPDGGNSAMPYMGTLVIRTWYEPDQVPGFRARLTYSRDPEGEPNTVSTANRDEALRIVRQWLIAQSGSPGDV